MTDQSQMMQWRNVTCPHSEPDSEMQEINEMEERLDPLPPTIERIRALISRVDPLSHYKAFENVTFLLEAIGEKDYERSPAIDVLWRHGEMDEERRVEAKCYIDALGMWLAGKEVAEAQEQHETCAATVESVFAALGERDEEKVWLARSLQKTLKELAYTPWDHIQEYDDAAFVTAVYQSLLGRPPSPDDLSFRLEELQQGKSREEFFNEIMQAPEHYHGHLACVAGHLKQGKDAA